MISNLVQHGYFHVDEYERYTPQILQDLNPRIYSIVVPPDVGVLQIHQKLNLEVRNHRFLG